MIRLPALTIWQPYLAGVLHGDGWCTRRAIGLRVRDRDFAETFSAGLRAVSNRDITARLDERGYWLVLSGNRSGRFDRLKSYEPRDNDELGAWLRGLFDSEGNAQLWLDGRKGPNSYHRRVAIYSTARSTIDRASEYLTWLDVPHSIRVTKNSRGHIGTLPVFELRMVRKDGFERFFVMVGTSISRKAETLRRIVSTYQPDGWQARNWDRAVLARHPHLRGGAC